MFIYLITDGLFIPFYEWVASVFEFNVLYGALLYVAVVVVCLLTGHAVIRLSECILSKINTHKFEDCSIFLSLTLSFVETRIIQGSRPLSWRFGGFGFFLTL